MASKKSPIFFHILSILLVLSGAFEATGRSLASWEPVATFLFEKKVLIVRERILESGPLRTEIQQGDKVLISRDTSPIGEGFKTAKYHPPLLFLVWGRGVHGETVVVLNYHSGEEIFLQHSSWPVDIVPKKGGVKLVWTGDRLAPKKYETFTKWFQLPRKR